MTSLGVRIKRLACDMHTLARTAYGCAVKHTAAGSIRRELDERDGLRGVERAKESGKQTFVTEVSCESWRVNQRVCSRVHAL
jgi:hypothetical protein